MPKNNRFAFRGRLLLLLILGAFILGSLVPRPGYAAPPPVPVCDPFNADGTVKGTRECECSQLKTDANYCLDPTEYLQLKVSQNVGAALLSGVEKFAGLLWFLDRLAVNFAKFALEGAVWTQIREALLAMLASILGGSGGVLDLIIRGPNGLFYLALIFAGLIMIVPFALFGQRPVKIERVFVWGVFIIALFIGSTQGFDLIGAVEQLRVNLMQTVLSGETVELSALVGAPMRATTSEATTITEANPLALPEAFSATYFPGVDSLDTWRFRVRVPTPLNNILDVIFPGVLYQDDALSEASNQAMGGVLLALLSLLPASILFLTGAVLMLLTAASLVLIIFFVAAIPLGFFEFGATILGGIARQYMGIILLSLFTAIFIRILAGLGVGIFGNDFTLSGMVVYAGGLGLVFVALQAALRQAWKALDGSAGMVQNAFAPVFASAGNLPYTSGPVSGAMENGQNTLNSAVQTASMLAMGAATGGGSLLAAVPALLAGSGAAPSSAPPPGDLQAVAAAFPSAAASGVLAAPAPPSGQPAPASSGATSGGGSAPASAPAPATPPTAHAHDRHPPVTPPGTRPFAPAHDPTYLTPDLQGLKDAEHAYFDAGDQVAARRLLAQGLGSNALAEATLEVYRTEGRPGAENVRQVVAQAQDTAARLPVSPVAQGAFTPAYLTALQDALRQAHLTGTPLFEALTQASARRVTAVDELPPEERAELLAYAVAAPDDPLLMIEDAAAQFRLHDLSEKMGWEADKLKGLFAHYDQALREAKRAGQPVHTALAQRLHADPAFAQDSEATRQEAARLAALVAGQAWIQLPTEAPASAGPAPSPAPSAAATPISPPPAPSTPPSPAPSAVTTPISPASAPSTPPDVEPAHPEPSTVATPISPAPAPFTPPEGEPPHSEPSAVATPPAGSPSPEGEPAHPEPSTVTTPISPAPAPSAPPEGEPAHPEPSTVATPISPAPAPFTPPEGEPAHPEPSTVATPIGPAPAPSPSPEVEPAHPAPSAVTPPPAPSPAPSRPPEPSAVVTPISPAPAPFTPPEAEPAHPEPSTAPDVEPPHPAAPNFVEASQPSSSSAELSSAAPEESPAEPEAAWDEVEMEGALLWNLLESDLATPEPPAPAPAWRPTPPPPAPPTPASVNPPPAVPGAGPAVPTPTPAPISAPAPAPAPPSVPPIPSSGEKHDA